MMMIASRLVFEYEKERPESFALECSICFAHPSMLPWWLDHWKFQRNCSNQEGVISTSPRILAVFIRTVVLYGVERLRDMSGFDSLPDKSNQKTRIVTCSFVQSSRISSSTSSQQS